MVTYRVPLKLSQEVESSEKKESSPLLLVFTQELSAFEDIVVLLGS